jgi:hypothetical protein
MKNLLSTFVRGYIYAIGYVDLKDTQLNQVFDGIDYEIYIQKIANLILKHIIMKMTIKFN